MTTKLKKEEKLSEDIGETVAEATLISEVIPENKPTEITPKTNGQTVMVASVKETELVVVNNLQQGFRIKKEKAHKNVKAGDYIII